MFEDFVIKSPYNGMPKSGRSAFKPSNIAFTPFRIPTILTSLIATMATHKIQPLSLAQQEHKEPRDIVIEVEWEILIMSGF